MKRQIFNLFLISACSMAILAALPLEKVNAQHQGLLVSPDTAPAYQKIPQIEQELYGHTYWNQSYSERIDRLERTLFGGTQRGAQELRLARLAQKMQEKSSANFHQNQEPMLAYLEEKLFQRTFADKSLPERVQQLESHVFGRSFENYPLEIRLKKLAYAIPIVAKEVRVAKDGIVVASTARKSQKVSPRANVPTPEMTQLDASKSNMMTPVGLTLSSGNYFQSIHRQPNGQLVRWSKLPIRVYVKPAEDRLEAVSSEALDIWRQNFSVEPVDSLGKADVVVDWEGSPLASGTLTRPFVHMGENRKIRTIILISMLPFKNASANSRLHGMLHQYGHAFGLWGHSDDPSDIMFPSQKVLFKDIPDKWSRRSAASVLRLPNEQPADFMTLQLQPSQRDINTLLRVYDEPALDLSTYNPYF